MGGKRITQKQNERKMKKKQITFLPHIFFIKKTIDKQQMNQ